MTGHGAVADVINAGSGTAGPAAIELDRLTKVYGRGSSALTAVDQVTLAVDAGQVFGFLGPNGSGKTTTIKMMSGLVTPTSGRARLHGFDVGRQRGQAVRQIGAVLEGSRNVYWSLSAWQNLLYFGRLKGLPGREIKPRAESLLTELGCGSGAGSWSAGSPAVCSRRSPSPPR